MINQSLRASDDLDADDNLNEETEDLGALGMSVKESDTDEDVADETVTVLPPAEAEADEPVDGLKQLETLEDELDEPALDFGDEDEDD